MLVVKGAVGVASPGGVLVNVGAGVAEGALRVAAGGVVVESVAEGAKGVVAKVLEGIEKHLLADDAAEGAVRVAAEGAVVERALDVGVVVAAKVGEAKPAAAVGLREPAGQVLPPTGAFAPAGHHLHLRRQSSRPVNLAVANHAVPLRAIPSHESFLCRSSRRGARAMCSNPNAFFKIRPEIFDFEPDLGLKLGLTKPTLSGTVPKKRHTTIPNDSGPTSVCFDDDPT